MVKALGFSSTEFDPTRPGRLCRGRERWIEAWAKLDEDDAVDAVQRLVVSGATFADDSARDALRGVVHSGVDLAQLVAALFPRKRLLAFMEDGHPADIPDDAEGIEAYEGYRAGGLTQIGLVRWHRVVSGVREIRTLIGDGTEERVLGFAQLDDDTDVDSLADALFQLVGMSTLDSPPARFQPMALPTVLERVRAVAVLHRDKHGPALGVYSRAPLKIAARLETLCDKTGTLLVPFAIPPMLARWDRALSELRVQWTASRADEFPVPACPDPDSWHSGRRRRRGKRGPRQGEPAAEAEVVEAEVAETAVAETEVAETEVTEADKQPAMEAEPKRTAEE